MLLLLSVFFVLYPYELTSLSNGSLVNNAPGIVLYPYELTSLSNTVAELHEDADVLYPYELTSLSNYNRLQART